MLSTRFLHWLASLALLVGLVWPGQAASRSSSLDSGIPLFLAVDTLIDSNDPALQACILSVPGDCSLRAAINRANAFPGLAVTISLPGGLYALDLPGSDDANQSGDLDLAEQITLTGDGQETTVISANRLDRVLDVQAGAVVSLSNLTLRDGQAGGGESGAGLRNLGNLRLERVTIAENLVSAASTAMPPQAGGSGGGIYNAGRLTVQDSLVANNAAGRGGDLPPPASYDSIPAGAGGLGGGIYNAGQLEINNSLVADNRAGDGGNGPACSSGCTFEIGAKYPGGPGGDGGGIFNSGWLTGSAIEVQANLAGTGGQGGYDFYYGSAGGRGGFGGGIYNSLWLSIQESTLAGNRSGEGGFAGWGWFTDLSDPPGYPGFGGGFYNAGWAEMIESQFVDNQLPPATLSSFYLTGSGGGLYNNSAGYLELLGCRLSGNKASGSGGGLENAGILELSEGQIETNSARENGGGIFNSGTLNVARTMIRANLTGPGYDGYQLMHYKGFMEPPVDGWSPRGGGIFNLGTATLNAVQLIDNQAGAGGHGGNSSNWYPGADGGDGGSGGGIYNSGDLELNLSLVQGNQAGAGGERGYNFSSYGDGLNGAGGSGGGIYNDGKLSGAFVDLRDNLAGAGYSETEPGGDGGGLASLDELHWRNSQMIGNRTQAGGNGGGLYLTPYQLPSYQFELFNTSVISNHAGADGGGIYLSGSYFYLWNLIVADNQVGPDRFGSGIYLADHDLSAANLTIAGNSGGDGSGVHLAAGNLVLADAIVAGQEVGIYVAAGTIAKLGTNLWGAGDWANGVDGAGPGEFIPGPNDFSADPRFLSPATSDYHLAANSPAIDAITAAGFAYDLDNQPRPAPVDGKSDLGADEFWPLIPLTGVTISGPPVVTAEQAVAFTAGVSPADATPIISYFWQPSPAAGQWTAAPTFVFPTEGVYRLQVTAFNAGSETTGELAVVVLPNFRNYYLPLVAKR